MGKQGSLWLVLALLRLELPGVLQVVDPWRSLFVVTHVALLCG